jgi:hypothetical protein
MLSTSNCRLGGDRTMSSYAQTTEPRFHKMPL